MRSRRFFFLLFLFVAAAHLAGIFVGVEWLVFWTKPVLMPVLALYFLFSAGRLPSFAVVATVTALVLSWCGDVLLMFAEGDERFFLLGLVAFLAAHIFYVIDFRELREGPIKSVRPGFIHIRVIVLTLAGSAIFFLLYPHLGSMTWPVGLYTITIFIMAFAALLRKGYTREKSFVMVYIGALLFVLSDTMIALDRFLSPLSSAPLLIMTSYLLAQFLIVRGIIAHSEPDVSLE